MKVGWQTKKLGELSDLITDGTHNSPEYVEAGIPMLDSKHVKDGFVIDDTEPEKFISLATDELLSKRCKPRAGDILISSRGSIGKIAIVREGQDFNIMGNMILIRLPNTINRNFTAFYLHSMVSHIESIARGVAQKGLYLNQVRDYEIPLPPLHEQQRIVAILDEAFEGIATATANAKKNLKKSCELFESTLQSVFTQLGDYPVVPISEVGEVFDGPHATPKTVDAGPIFLGISSLQDGHINLGETRHVTADDFQKWTRRVKPQAGDVVFSYETRLGQTAIIPEGLECCLGRRMGLVRVNRKRLDPRFFVFQYISPTFRKFLDSKTIRGATVDRIALKEFPSFPISLPPIDVQKAIVAKLDELSAETKKLEAIYQQKLVALDELKKSILNQAFSGQLS